MPPEPTTYLTAGQVMDRSAAVLNDAAKTDFTYVAQLPYLNMAIDELQEQLEAHNMSPANKSVESYITIPVGTNKITPVDHPDVPHYPFDMIEIRSLKERLSGTTDPFVLMNRKDDILIRPAVNALIDWTWEEQIIKFLPAGANTERQIELAYVRQPLQLAQNESSFIGVINSRSYLAFKTASFCARFIGENPTRADELDELADGAMDRLLGIGAKGRQSVVTRRRPFRSSYKMRGWF